ncbi:hypothetical protein ACHAO8_006218 [Botrytis cinerea]
MVEEHYNNRHRSTNWKVSQPIEDWYHQSIRDLSGLGIDENRMNRKWKKVVRKGYEEAAEKEQKAAGKGWEKKRAIPIIVIVMGEEEENHIMNLLIAPVTTNHQIAQIPVTANPNPPNRYISLRKRKRKRKKKKIIRKENPGGRFVGIAQETVRSNTNGLNVMDSAVLRPVWKKNIRAKEKQEEREKEKTPPYEEKKVHCTCGYRYCRHKVFEIEEIAKPPMPRYFFNK